MESRFILIVALPISFHDAEIRLITVTKGKHVLSYLLKKELIFHFNTIKTKYKYFYS